MANSRPAKGGLEVRIMGRGSAPKLENGKLSGRAAPFNRTAMIGKKPWGFREKISPGAFSKSIKDGDIVLLDNHDSAKPIARQSAGTLSLAETKGGLDWDAVPANTTIGNDAVENARAGNYGGCSFGFEVVRDSWNYNKDDDVDERTLHEVKLHEISVCTFPAYGEGTSVSARDQVKAAKEARKAYYRREYGVWVEDGISDEDIRLNKTPYGDVKYADPGYQKDGQKRYPIDTKAHAKAAWSYINKKANQAPYSSKQLASIKSKIMAACKKFGITVSGAAKGGKSKSSSSSSDNGRALLDEMMTKRTKLTEGTRKLLATVRDIAFDETFEDVDAQLANIRKVLLAGLVRESEDALDAIAKAERKAAKRAKKLAERGDPFSVGTAGFPPISDDDEDDPICPACHGSGKGPDGVAMCAGGCAGTGRLAGPGDDEGQGSENPKEDSSWGLGLGSGGHSQGQASGNAGGSDNPAVGDLGGNLKEPAAGSQGNAPAAGDGASEGGGGKAGGAKNSPKIGKGGVQLGKPSGLTKFGSDKSLTQYSKDLSGEKRQNGGQPDTSTDPEGDEDSARIYRARLIRARMRRDEFDAEA